ncbi:MAG: hypothetical protein GQ559_05305 [Desulfobulbaceae bacterium]|nr:hypothetical protein [Desulfobulbaceae bacterium]
MRYRAQIREFVAGVVRDRVDKRAAAGWIAKKAAAEIPVDDRDRFIEVIETELGGLHEGNIARYRLRPTEFTAWIWTWR